MIEKTWNFIKKRDPKRAQLKSNSEVKKQVKKKKWKFAVAPETSLGAPWLLWRKTFLQENNCTEKKQNKNQRRARAERKKHLRNENQEPGPQHAPADRGGTPGPERISIAVGNIPAPGLGKLGAVQICCHAEISVKYNLRMPTYRFCCNLVI